MEDISKFEPPEEKINQSFADFNINEIINDHNINNDDYKDFQEIINLFGQEKPKNKGNNDNNISQSFIKNKNSEKIMNLNEEFFKKTKKFLLKAYRLICSDDEQNELIDKEKIEEESEIDCNDNNNELNFINIIKKLIENKEEFYTMEILIEKENCTYNDRYFNINLKENHQINMCNDLLKMKIEIIIEIDMAIRSGNVQIKFYHMNINYNEEKNLELQPNLKCTIINSKIGKRGMTYCTCENCDRCKKRKNYKFPFDSLLNYLKEQNKINDDLKLTYLYFKGCNSYKNDSNYKCSFCQDFYAKQSNIVRLFCNKEIDPDHACQFWICKDCFYKKYKYSDVEICPNCKKFKVNFSNLKSYYNWMNSKH